CHNGSEPLRSGPLVVRRIETLSPPGNVAGPGSSSNVLLVQGCSALALDAGSLRTLGSWTDHGLLLVPANAAGTGRHPVGADYDVQRQVRQPRHYSAHRRYRTIRA